MAMEHPVQVDHSIITAPDIDQIPGSIQTLWAVPEDSF